MTSAAGPGALPASLEEEGEKKERRGQREYEGLCLWPAGLRLAACASPVGPASAQAVRGGVPSVQLVLTAGEPEIFQSLSAHLFPLQKAHTSLSFASTNCCSEPTVLLDEYPGPVTDVGSELKDIVY